MLISELNPMHFNEAGDFPLHRRPELYFETSVWDTHAERLVSVLGQGVGSPRPALKRHIFRQREGVLFLR
jgi:hypothetical protein